MAIAMDNRGGGQALPPYLQGRTMANATDPYQTKPMITPASTVTPGEVKPTTLAGQTPNGITPKTPTPPLTPQPGNAPPGPQTLYDFLKSDLEKQRSDALANATTDASARGVYYGTPLTTSYGDINTSFLKGLGSLQAGIVNNANSDELQRIQAAAGLLNGQPQSSAGGIDPNTLQQLGALFGGSNAAASARNGPSITPNKKGIDNAQDTNKNYG